MSSEKNNDVHLHFHAPFTGKLTIDFKNNSVSVDAKPEKEHTAKNEIKNNQRNTGIRPTPDPTLATTDTSEDPLDLTRCLRPSALSSSDFPLVRRAGTTPSFSFGGGV